MSRSNCLQMRRNHHQVKYRRLNANTCSLAAILFSGHPFIGRQYHASLIHTILLRWLVLMNIINEHTFLLTYFLYCACFEQQKLYCSNVASLLACIKSKQSGEYTMLSARTATVVKTAVCDGSFSPARFHVTVDRYRSFFSGWLQAHVWMTCSSARKTWKQQIHTPAHSVSVSYRRLAAS